MSIQEFQRWAEGQRVPGSVRAFVAPKSASDEQTDDHNARRAETSEESDGSARRFLGTLRWGK